MESVTRNEPETAATSKDSATAAAVAEVERGEQNPFVAAHRLLGSGALLREWLETLGGRT